MELWPPAFAGGHLLQIWKESVKKEKIGEFCIDRMEKTCYHSETRQRPGNTNKEKER